MDTFVPSDPKTVMVKSILGSGYIEHGPRAVLTASVAAKALAGWIHDMAGDLPSNDERLSGYLAFADLLDPQRTTTEGRRLWAVPES